MTYAVNVALCTVTGTVELVMPIHCLPVCYNRVFHSLEETYHIHLYNARESIFYK